MNRRQFMTAFAAAAAAAALPHRFSHGDTAAAPNAPAAAAMKKAADRIKLGPHGVELSRLAIGTGSTGWGGSSNQTRQLGLQGLARLLEDGVDKGVTFWDSADQYGSHPHIKEALKAVSRDKVTIMTKTRAKTAKEMRADLDRFREELGTERIDILLLHCMTSDNWNVERRGAMDVIEEAQQKGIVGTRGVSCHTLGALKTAAAEPWVEVDLARLNPRGVAMDGKPEVVIPILKEMKAKGKGVIGMKVFGDGKLASEPDKMLQYALSQDCIDCFTIGVEKQEHLDDLIRRIPAVSAA